MATQALVNAAGPDEAVEMVAQAYPEGWDGRYSVEPVDGADPIVWAWEEPV